MGARWVGTGGSSDIWMMRMSFCFCFRCGEVFWMLDDTMGFPFFFLLELGVDIGFVYW